MTVEIGEVVKAVVEMVLPDGTISQNVYHYLLLGDNAQADGDVKTQSPPRLRTCTTTSRTGLRTLSS